MSAAKPAASSLDVVSEEVTEEAESAQESEDVREVDPDGAGEPEAVAVDGFTSSVQLTAAATGMRCMRYTRLAGEYITTDERSARAGRYAER